MMELYESAMIWQGSSDITSIIPLPLIPHYIFVYCTQPRNSNTTTAYESNYNILQSNITTVKLFPKPGSPKKTTNYPPPKKTTSLFSPLCFSPKNRCLRPSGRSWLPKPMPGSARASCAAVRATRPGSWMPCNDASEEHGGLGTARPPFFEGSLN